MVNKRFQGIPEMSKCNNFLANDIDIGRVSYLTDFVPTSRYGEIYLYIYICFVVFGYFFGDRMMRQPSCNEMSSARVFSNA